jgi:hypothetical protein
MHSEMSKKIWSRFIDLGFKPRTGHETGCLEFVKNENEHISVDPYGFVYVHHGFNKYRGEFSPICVASFEADTLAKIEVLVEPLLK